MSFLPGLSADSFVRMPERIRPLLCPPLRRQIMLGMQRRMRERGLPICHYRGDGALIWVWDPDFHLTRPAPLSQADRRPGDPLPGQSAAATAAGGESEAGLWLHRGCADLKLSAAKCRGLRCPAGPPIIYKPGDFFPPRRPVRYSVQRPPSPPPHPPPPQDPAEPGPSCYGWTPDCGWRTAWQMADKTWVCY